MAEKEKKVSFKETLNLPRTDFPIRPNAKVDDPAMVKRWESENLFDKSFYHNQGNEKFVLHDGPPYANGNIHIGTAYNKTLKDIECKYQRMSGKQVPVTPGWDCHGLPIELKVTKEHPDARPHELKKECRAFAQKWVDIQRQEFKDLGVLFNWENPYLTMNFDYESRTLQAFGEFVDKGYIERKNKTVPWCASCQTVLATAEIEYHERKDPSIYVLFPLEQQIINKLLPNLKDKPVNLLVWTTTPWTLPLNRAVMIKPNATYVVLEKEGKYFVVGKQLAQALCDLFGIEKKIIAEFKSDDLIGLQGQIHHPFIKDLLVPLIPSEFVSLNEGTAFVHCAPGCGPEDYEVAIKNKLEIFSPISSDGKYTTGITPKELEGMPVTRAVQPSSQTKKDTQDDRNKERQSGQIWVIKKLAANGNLLFKNNIRHSYPHCWRCRNGLIFRATKQWFCDLTKHNLKVRVLEAIQSIKTLPKKSVNRLRATVEGRLEWCLSRQRIWGTPIPALICKQCDYAYVNKQFVDKVAKEVKKNGIEYWDLVDPQVLLPKNFVCPNCEGSSFKKETDILDVWFDSGISHYAVLKTNPELAFPANMYLEGKDQHRGWFQSSLLTAMVLEGEPPMKSILTHGFVVDAKGHKMSKSLGNVVSPTQMIAKLGTDGLRLWVSSIDYTDDAVVSDILIRNVQEVFRKIRNTLRFLLSNLYDFDIKNDAVDFEKLLTIDKYTLQQLYAMQERILNAYKKGDFTAVFHLLADYCSKDLSSFYLDIIKDRLYVEISNGPARRSAQTACWFILNSLTKLIAPILSFTAEQISDFYQKDKTKSIHLQDFADLQPIWQMIANRYREYPLEVLNRDLIDLDRLQNSDQLKVIAQLDKQWDILYEIRSAILKAIEGLREKGVIKHSLESSVKVYFDFDENKSKLLKNFLEQFKNGQDSNAFFKEFMIVSQFNIASNKEGLTESELPGLFINVQQAPGVKCPRCWHWDISDHDQGLCNRCQKILR